MEKIFIDYGQRINSKYGVIKDILKDLSESKSHLTIVFTSALNKDKNVKISRNLSKSIQTK